MLCISRADSNNTREMTNRKAEIGRKQCKVWQTERKHKLTDRLLID